LTRRPHKDSLLERAEGGATGWRTKMDQIVTFAQEKLDRLKRGYRKHGLTETIYVVFYMIIGHMKSEHPDYSAYEVLSSFLCTNAWLIRRFRRPGKISNQDKIKVLHVTCSFDLGGTQRQIKNLCEFDRDGAYIHQTTEVFPELNYLYRNGERLDRQRYIRGNSLTRKMGELIMSPSLRSLRVLQIYKMVRDFEATRPDVVVGWGHEMAMLSFVAAALARVPKIVFCIRTFNPSHGWTDIGPLLHKAHKNMLPYLGGIIVNSSLSQQDYARWLSIPTDMIRVCPNGITPRPTSQGYKLRCLTEVRSRHSIPDDAVVVVHVGRFSKEKGQMLLVRAYRRLVERRPQDKVYCLLCGEGPTRSEVQDYVDYHQLSNVLLVGQIYNIESYLNASDIFVMSSDFEGMPNAMMEAMAYGLPCISTNRTGALDIARDNLEALYVDVGSVEQLVNKLCYLMERPTERHRIGTNAKERLKEFSVSNMITTMNRHLEEIIRE
jgi:GalNAc-alpha-(1->4)-GalNAc-alpha-(1->3)-diNAcBac-PP-undecaprenol alpha-1,4-N-acetyl-D-galactosaminyltransferase